MATGEAGRVLLIEDDREISGVVAMTLADLNLETDQVYDGREGLEKAVSGDYVLVVLDLMLPGMDGISIVTELRKVRPAIPVLMLTAKAEEIDRVLGLELGADDYMTKPFSIRELTARVKALLRRARLVSSAAAAGGDNGACDILAIGALKLDLSRHSAWLNGGPLDLTAKEFELLGLFMKNPGRAYSRSDLLRQVWEYDFEGYEHTVSTHINRLRNKIESDPSDPKYLKTVWGVGYRFIDIPEVVE